MKDYSPHLQIWLIKSKLKQKTTKIKIKLQLYKKKYIFQLGFTPCKAEQPLRDVVLQEKEVQKN